MISRVAESCFWIHRYIERAESTARLLLVHGFAVLDAEIQTSERWRPVVVVLGEEERFLDLVGVAGLDDDDVAERYLTWDERNAISIRNSVFWARENARTVREVIGQEMWEALNVFWHWLDTDKAERRFVDDRADFYRRVQSMAAQFHGVCQSSMLHEEPFDFMRLGMLLERVNQTARVMDVKHHMLSTASGEPHLESPEESAQWLALLRFCSATEAFLKRAGGVPTGLGIAEFLLKEQVFPRSIVHGLDRARNFLIRIEKGVGMRHPSRARALLRPLLDGLRSKPVEEILAEGIHEKLTEIIQTTASICESVHDQFFDPGPSRLAGAAQQ